MKLKHAITILLFGTMWGFLEATLGGLLHLARIPFTGMIMSSIGFSLLYLALKSGVKPAQLFIVSLIAASFKFMDIWMFGIPIMDHHIVNPATAIACQGLASAVLLSGRAKELKPLALAPRFLGATAIAMVAFNAISVGVYGWGTFHTASPITAALIKLPLTVVFTTAICALIPVVQRRIQTAISPAWQGTMALLLVALTVAAKTYI